MTIGDNIKRARAIRGLTQKELGKKVGLSDVRIRHYELGIRTPKEDMLQKIADALDTHILALKEPSLDSDIEVMHILIRLEEKYGLTITPQEEGGPTLSFSNFYIQDLIDNWNIERRQYIAKRVSKQEYDDWKLSYPLTANKTSYFDDTISPQAFKEPTKIPAELSDRFKYTQDDLDQIEARLKEEERNVKKSVRLKKIRTLKANLDTDSIVKLLNDPTGSIRATRERYFKDEITLEQFLDHFNYIIEFDNRPTPTIEYCPICNTDLLDNTFCPKCYYERQSDDKSKE